MYGKPDSCIGCPLYGDGKGFVPDVLWGDTEVQIVAQNPGVDEEMGRMITGWENGQPIYASCMPQPLIGRTGWETNKYMKLAGVERFSKSNVLKCRAVDDKGKKTNKLPSGKLLEEAMDHCTSHHFKFGPSVKYVLAMGAIAWRALGGPGSITNWRGFRIPRD